MKVMNLFFYLFGSSESFSSNDCQLLIAMNNRGERFLDVLDEHFRSNDNQNLQQFFRKSIFRTSEYIIKTFPLK